MYYLARSKWVQAAGKSITGDDGKKIKYESIEDSWYEDSKYQRRLRGASQIWDEIEKSLGDDQHLFDQSRPYRQAAYLGDAIIVNARHGDPIPTREQPHCDAARQQATKWTKEQRSSSSTIWHSWNPHAWWSQATVDDHDVQ